MNALHWVPINTEFGHSARFLPSFKTVCTVENGPPRPPAPSFVLCGSNSAAHRLSHAVPACLGPDWAPFTPFLILAEQRVEHYEIGYYFLIQNSHAIVSCLKIGTRRVHVSAKKLDSHFVFSWKELNKENDMGQLTTCVIAMPAKNDGRRL
jgi:hypothetical protein